MNFSIVSNTVFSLAFQNISGNNNLNIKWELHNCSKTCVLFNVIFYMSFFYVVFLKLSFIHVLCFFHLVYFTCITKFFFFFLSVIIESVSVSTLWLVILIDTADNMTFNPHVIVCHMGLITLKSLKNVPL